MDRESDVKEYKPRPKKSPKSADAPRKTAQSRHMANQIAMLGAMSDNFTGGQLLPSTDMLDFAEGIYLY